MEEHLHLDASPAHALLGPRLVPYHPGALQRLDRLARPVQLLQAVAAPEQAEVIGVEGGEGTIVPAQRLRPLLLALEVPTDRTVKHGGTAGRQLGTSEQVALDLVLVAEHAEGTSDLVQQFGRVPEIVARQVVQPAVSGNNQMVLTAGGQDANPVEDR